MQPEGLCYQRVRYIRIVAGLPFFILCVETAADGVHTVQTDWPNNITLSVFGKMMALRNDGCRFEI